MEVLPFIKHLFRKGKKNSMSKYFYSVLFSAALALLMAGCGYDDDNIEPVIDGKEYAPLNIGSKRTYRVTDTTYTGANTYSSSRYWIQEEITESFTDLEGQTAFKAVRSKLMDTTDLSSWEIDSVIVYKSTNAHFERVQNNIRVIDLVFPVKKDKTWNPNALNENQEAAESYAYQEVAVPAVLNGQSYDNTLLVSQDNSTPLLFDVINSERYAKDIGLISRYRTRLSYEVLNGDLTGNRSGGAIIHQVLIPNP
jgi:hypothetical protein